MATTHLNIIVTHLQLAKIKNAHELARNIYADLCKNSPQAVQLLPAMKQAEQLGFIIEAGKVVELNEHVSALDVQQAIYDRYESDSTPWRIAQHYDYAIDDLPDDREACEGFDEIEGEFITALINHFNVPMYRVKLSPGHLANQMQALDGYLADGETIMQYTKGQAVKKARMFGGKIERVI